jgi:S1-C subfamily serine protease
MDYAGTCFAFRHANVFLTAKHCVLDSRPETLVIVAQDGKQLRVHSTAHHPTADLSALVTDPNEAGVRHPFLGLHVLSASHGIGQDFVAFGFPIGGTLVEPPNVPTPRVLRGYIQRLADFRSGGSDPYRALELSIPATAGLSGGPVFPPTDPGRVFGMVTGNFDSYTTEELVEMTSDDATPRSVRRVVSYGMALSLWGVEHWLAEVAPLVGSALW